MKLIPWPFMTCFSNSKRNEMLKTVKDLRDEILLITKTKWPFLHCLSCGHGQTFHHSLVRGGRALGWCDGCGANRHWKLMKKVIGLIGLIGLMGCTSLTPERVDLLVAIAGQAAQIGAANWLAKHPTQRPVFDLVIATLSALARRGETNQMAYINVLQSLPLETLSGPAGDVNVTEPKLVIWDADAKQATVVNGKAEMPVVKATIAGLKRGVAPKPPLPGKLRFK